MSRGRAILTGLLAGPALGAVVGLLDCLRAAAEGGTILTPAYWPQTVAFYALFWIPLGLLSGVVGAFVFRRRGPAVFLLVVLGSAAFAYGAWMNIVKLPSFTSRESLTFDALLLGGAAAAFLLLYLTLRKLPVPRAKHWILLLAAPLIVAGAAALLHHVRLTDGKLAVETEPGAPPNVLLYLVDTLRADHLGAYGHDRPTSPRFDAFAEEAALFTRCHAASTWTKPSTASIHTGLLPGSHGAVEHREILPEAAVTLAELLKGAGSRTAAFSDNPFVSPEFGFGQGFEEFDYEQPSVFVNGTLLGKALWTLRVVSLSGRMVGEKLASARGSPELVRRALAFVDAESDEPWFVYIHAMEPHLPYDPPAPYRGRFADSDYDGPDLDRPPPYLGFLPFEKGTALPEDQRRHLVARYDEEILAWDAAFGTLLDALAARGVLDDTIVVVVSDHGEEFHEHGGWTHGHSLYEELMHVPFAIRAPGVVARRVETPVRTTDLFSTVLTLAGIRATAPPFSQDLAPALRAGREPTALPALAEVRIGGVGADGIISGDHKLVVARQGSRSVTERFDLSVDPTEQHPLAEADWSADLGRLLGDALVKAHAAALESSEREISGQMAETLRQLGYVAPK